jgi:hypothetical protein
MSIYVVFGHPQLEANLVLGVFSTEALAAEAVEEVQRAMKTSVIKAELDLKWYAAALEGSL